ncbi:MAG: hypothetical protein NZ700_06650 [Gemmataceae bacterium]|nr:hypothetical protein [Gemmataceae bacterium]MDW8267027.1 hypothetical protein [Gemmataceae bacterium]
MNAAVKVLATPRPARKPHLRPQPPPTVEDLSWPLQLTTVLVMMAAALAALLILFVETAR